MTAVTAVVLAARGGARLTRALDSVAWADERIVWDPAHRLQPAALPAGVQHVAGYRQLATLGMAPWLLLLEEGEAVDAADAGTVAAAPTAGPCTAYRCRRVVHAFGGMLRVGGAPIRLARRTGARLEVGSGLALGIATAGEVGRLDVALVVRCAAEVGAALDDLDADGAALAVLLDGARMRARVHRLLPTVAIAGGRLLVGRARPGLGWGRWIVSVLGGYRALVAYAKLWEVQRRQAVAPW